MSAESRLTLRRGRAKESDRPISEPDFSYSSAKLEEFVPAGYAKAAKTPAATATAIVEAPAVAATPAVQAAPASPGLDEVLQQLLTFDGAMSVALVDSETGMILGKAGSGVEMELAAAGASVILRARLAATRALGANEKIDDVLISLTSQVQVIHPLPKNPTIFTYLIGDKAKASIAMARHKATEADLQIRL